jgi:hypothetical protein
VDLPSPIKRHPTFQPYRALEGRLEDLIQARFGLQDSADIHGQVKRADLRLLATEARDLMGPAPKMWVALTEPPCEARIYPWSPSHARKMFLARFATVMLDRVDAALGICNGCGGALRLGGEPLVRGLWAQKCIGCGGDFGLTGLLDAAGKAIR